MLILPHRAYGPPAGLLAREALRQPELWKPDRSIELPNRRLYVPDRRIRLPGRDVEPVPQLAAFSLVQGWIQNTNSTTGTFTNTPTVGNLAVVVLQSVLGQLTTATVADGNSNAYSPTTSTPFNNATVGSGVGIFYWLVTGTPSKTVTLTSTGGGSIHFYIAEFSGNASSSVLDTDNTAFSTTTATTITSPSITPAGANELFVSAAALNAGTITTAVSPWTAIGATPVGEYQITTGSSAQAVSYTMSTGHTWVAIEAAFKPASTLLPVGTPMYMM